MSLGESSLTVRKIIFDSEDMITSGRNRINIDNILNIPPDIPPDIYDIFIINDIVFSYSEWDKVKEYANKAREKGKTIIFKTCYVVQDDNLSTDFYKKGSTGYEYHFKHYKDENNNDGSIVLEGSFSAGEWDKIQATFAIVDLIKEDEKGE